MSAIAKQTDEAEIKKALSKKWGDDIIAVGYTAVPEILLKRMAVLGLSPGQMILIIQLLSYWWSSDQLPFPSKKALATAIGCSEKTVQKNISVLVKLGFLTRMERKRSGDRNESNIYGFKPLINILTPLAKTELAERAQHREAKQARMTPGSRRPTFKKPQLVK